MKIIALISNYERQEMLEQLLTELDENNINTYIIDDHSSYTHERFDVVNDYNYNKKEYWITFNTLLQYCKDTPYDVYMFMPNDYSKIDFERIRTYATHFKDKPYIFNIVNDGREMCWNLNKPLFINNDLKLVYFTDCGFFTNYETLQLLEFKIDPISPNRFKTPHISSGVGQQLTNRLNNIKVPIYMPTKSLAYHGEHESVMHKETRKNNPLISK